MKERTFRLPDNWHAHLRQNDLLRAVYHHFNIYGRVLCMGNTSPLIETASDAIKYRYEIQDIPTQFEPVMCIMLTQDTTPEIIYEAAKNGIKFVKFIPIGTSTGATKGLRIDDIKELYRIFPAIIETEMYLLLHAEYMSELSGNEVHLIEREKKAIAIVSIFHKTFPEMKITVEHASTIGMIDFVESCDSRKVRATLTPHHALLTYADTFDGQDRLINPFNYCLPVLKRQIDRQAVAEAMTSGDKHFFAGADSAPHWAYLKKRQNPPPGIFFGSSEYLRYLEVFERENALDKFEDFTSRFGAEYYGYSLNEGTITVVKEEWEQPRGEGEIIFCMGGEKLGYRITKRNGVPIVV